ncbi:uncharacterized protein LOC117219885 [Megalopta genalis]|uniref:uncharacterized protein LOC117219885 n=1 Tax=Megalopta genalis TaxID=115081 RepID=UPI003FD2C003
MTEIRLELKEASQDVGLVGLMSPKSNVTVQNNSTYLDGIPEAGIIMIKIEETFIVLLVLFLWIVAVALFFNRWGKIRMLEPSQPKYQDQHRQSCPAIDQNLLQNRFTYPKCTSPCGDELTFDPAQMCPRQCSVFNSRSALLHGNDLEISHRSKSAVDLRSSIHLDTNSRKNNESMRTDETKNLNSANEFSKVLQCDRRTIVRQIDDIEAIEPSFQNRKTSASRIDVPQKSWCRIRGINLCRYNRMDALGRTTQRERAGSICHFNRMDVLAKPSQRDRAGSIYCFDRKDVLFRSNFAIGKSLMKKRRVSTGNFMEKNEKSGQCAQRNNGSIIDDIDVIEDEMTATEQPKKQETLVRCSFIDKKNTIYHLDRPSCSKTSDTVVGYRVTCL